MSTDDLVRYFGSQIATARALGVDKRVVNYWFTKGQIPRGRQFEIQVLTGGRLKVETAAA